MNRLPDPDLFRDAVFLWRFGRFSARDLDDMDALLFGLIHRLANTKTRSKSG